MLNLESVSHISGGEATMMYSSRSQIYALFLESKIRLTLARDLTQVRAIATSRSYIYWSEHEEEIETIVRKKVGKDKEVIVTTGKPLINDIYS